MIKKIVIKGEATYPKEGVTFEDLQKVNFIYGGNGTGKTTLSRVIGSANRKEVFPKCKVVWEKDEMPVLTYNKDFRERNFNEYIPGIFTLGEDAAKSEKEMERLQAEQKKMLKQAGEAKRAMNEYEKQIEEEKNELEERIKKSVYDKYRRKYGKCLKAYQNAAAAGKNIVDAVIHQRGHLFPPLPLDYYLEYNWKEKYEILYEHPERNFMREFYSLDSSLDMIVEIAEDPIWKRRIVGSENVAIGALIQKLGLADWVRQGQQIVKSEKIKDESEAGVCPFCQQKTITKHFKEELEAFFNDEYEEASKRILELEMQNSTLVQNMLKALDETEKLAQEQELTEREMLDVVAYRTNAQRLKEMMWANTKQFMAKRAEPSRQIEMLNIREVAEVLKEQIKKANEAIVDYNKLLANQNKERRYLYDALWNKMVGEAEADVKAAYKKIRGKEKLWKKWQKQHEETMAEYERLGVLIKEKHEGIISMQPTVDSINRSLNQFGFTGFRLSASPKMENHYQIERPDGTLAADTLSEGEVTFITFLYYMQMARATDRNSKWIVVIDDPISSLDSSVMFVVSTMVRGLLNEVRTGKGNVEQAFVLTHNVYFHKETSYINTRANKQKDTHHWLLYKQGNVTSVKAFGMENPIKGSYDLLWKELRDYKGKEGEMDNISLQNTLRRIIETYFVTFGGQKKNAIIPENFGNDSDELTIASSFAKWFDEGSHDILDDFYVEHPREMNAKYLEFFRQMFERSGHGAHYKMMMHEEV